MLKQRRSIPEIRASRVADSGLSGWYNQGCESGRVRFLDWLRGGSSAGFANGNQPDSQSPSSLDNNPVDLASSEIVGHRSGVT